jgi:hypothetical protein
MLLDGRAGWQRAVEESMDLEAAGWIGGGSVGWANWRLGIWGRTWLSVSEDWGNLVVPVPTRPGAAIYMALQYYQNILVVSFVKCSDVHDGRV